MKSFNENILVKSVFAYIDLFYKLFPLFIIFYFLPIVLTLPTMSGAKPGVIDVFGFFRLEGTDTEAQNLLFWQKAIVLIFNFCAAIGIYISLKKLTSFIKNVFNEEPFCESNGKVLKFVGFFVAGITLVKNLLQEIMLPYPTSKLISTFSMILMKTANILSIIFNPYLVVGLFIAILGEIIIKGTLIKNENDLTV